MLGFEAQLSAEEGNIGLPYVSDDIGTYNGGRGPRRAAPPTSGRSRSVPHLPDDLYARWVQFGTFQPLDRLHSNHGDRLPWEYGARADAAADGFLRLREALNPYIYTLARDAYDTGLPITGALYLEWPGLAAAYQHPAEYTFGPDMVVEPVTRPATPRPRRSGSRPARWFDYFTGAALPRPAQQSPVGAALADAGAGPRRVDHADPAVRAIHGRGPEGSADLTAFPGARGSFSLYDDQGGGIRLPTGASPGRGSRSAARPADDAHDRGRRGAVPGGAPAAVVEVRLLGVARPAKGGPSTAAFSTVGATTPRPTP